MGLCDRRRVGRVGGGAGAEFLSAVETFLAARNLPEANESKVGCKRAQGSSKLEQAREEMESCKAVQAAGAVRPFACVCGALQKFAASVAQSPQRLG